MATTLLHQEDGIAIQQAVGAVRVEGLVGENTQHDDAQRAAHTVNAPHVERIVPVQLVLHLNREVANHAGDDADDDGGSWRNVAGSGGYGCQTGDRAGKQARGISVSSR